MPKQLRLGIVGLGIGKVNGKAIAANPRGRIVALCDIIETKMDEFARELGGDVKKYVDYHELCADGEVDAVFVGTPNQLHVPVILAAVRHDKHVMSTKPLADALPPAQKAVSAAEAAGVVNMMSLSSRFSPEYQHFGELSRQGYFGEIYYAKARSIRRSGIPAWNLGFIQAGGGAFRDMGVHVLDAAWWLMGMPQPVSVCGVAGAKFGPRGLGYWDFVPQVQEISRQFAADDYGGGFIRFDNGAGMQVESFWASHQPEEFQVELFGTEAGAKLNPPTLYRTAGLMPQETVMKLPRKPSAWDTIASHFIECCLDGVPCQAPLRHGLIVQQMMESLLKSARGGREVRL